MISNISRIPPASILLSFILFYCRRPTYLVNRKTLFCLQVLASMILLFLFPLTLLLGTGFHELDGHEALDFMSSYLVNRKTLFCLQVLASMILLFLFSLTLLLGTGFHELDGEDVDDAEGNFNA